MYSSMQENQLEEIRTTFEATFPDIEMVYFASGTGKILTKVSAELQSDSLEADLLWVADPCSYESLIASDLFEPYESLYAHDLSQEYRRDDFLLTPARLIVMGFIYNSHFVEKASVPKTWKELPSFGKVGISDPVSSGTSLATLRILTGNSDYGWEYIKQLKDQGAILCSGSGATAYQVGEGECKLAITPDNVGYMTKSLGLPVEFYAPKEDAIVYSSPLGLFRKSKHKQEAKIFIDFILSDEGQRVLYSVGVTPIRGPLVPHFEHRMKMTEQQLYSKEELLAQFDTLFGIE
ncbi:MAG: extracellular solute-binding protein [Sphaerochaetaceae bacterium]